jgi:hypothetical protein
MTEFFFYPPSFQISSPYYLSNIDNLISLFFDLGLNITVHDCHLHVYLLLCFIEENDNSYFILILWHNEDFLWTDCMIAS